MEIDELETVINAYRTNTDRQLDDLFTRVDKLEKSDTNLHTFLDTRLDLMAEKDVSLDKKIKNLKSYIISSERLIAEYIINAIKRDITSTIESIPFKGKLEKENKEVISKWLIKECENAVEMLSTSKKPIDVPFGLWFFILEKLDEQKLPTLGSSFEHIIEAFKPRKSIAR